jgi:dienelactone hydrolase
MSNRFDNRGLMEHLTRQGYVVVSADFPLTHRGAPGGENVLDIEYQPADVSFLIDSLLSDEDLPTRGLVDGENIGAFGVSLGAMTSLMLGYHPEFGDPRIDAVVAAAPPTCFAPAQMLDSGLPLLLIHGDNDSILPYGENSEAAYPSAIAPKFFVTINAGNHANFPDAGLIMEALPNSDTIGCSAIASNIPVADMGTLAEAIGGRPAAEVNAQCSAPCIDVDSAPESISPVIQHDIFNAGTTAFFNYYLRDDERGLGFLVYEFEDSFPEDMSLEFDLSE